MWIGSGRAGGQAKTPVPSPRPSWFVGSILFSMLFALALPLGKRRAAVFVRSFLSRKRANGIFCLVTFSRPAPQRPRPGPQSPRAPRHANARQAVQPPPHPAISSTTRAAFIPAALTASAALPTPPPILTNDAGARYRQNPYCGVRKPLASVWELSYKPRFPSATREILAAGDQVEGKRVPYEVQQKVLSRFIKHARAPPAAVHGTRWSRAVRAESLVASARRLSFAVRTAAISDGHARRKCGRGRHTFVMRLWTGASPRDSS